MDISVTSSVDSSSHDLLQSHSTAGDIAPVNSSFLSSLIDAVTVSIDQQFLFSHLSDSPGYLTSDGGYTTENQLGKFGFLGLGDYRIALINGHCSLTDLDNIFGKARKYVFTNFGGQTILLNPRSDFMFIWQLFNLLFTLLCIFFVPIEVAFATESLNISSKRLGAFLEVFFMCDICVNLNLPIQDKRSQCLITDRRLIWQHYCQTWLLVDVLSCLPLDLIEILVELTGHDVAVMSSLSILRLTRIFKISKVTRLIRANMIIVYVQDFLHLSSEVVELLKLFFLVLLTIHFMGCGLFVVSHFETHHTNWEEVNELEGESIFARYWVGVYWAGMTATTIGYGDIVMITSYERMYSTLCMVIGASVYALVTSRLVGMLLLSRSNSGMTSGNDTDISSFDVTLRELRIPLIYRSILMDYVYEKELNDSFQRNVSVLLQKLSPQLRALTAELIHGPWIKRVPFICGNTAPSSSFISCSKELGIIGAFASEIVNHIECFTFAPGELIRTKIVGLDDSQETVPYLYIVTTENASVVRRKRGRICNTLSRHDCFGEEEILLDSLNYLLNYTYQNSIFCYCNVLAVPKPMLLASLRKFPSLIKNYLRHQIKFVFRLRVGMYLTQKLSRMQREGTTHTTMIE